MNGPWRRQTVQMPDPIVELCPADTHPLRRAVLRTGTASDVVVFDGDDESATFHLGAERNGEIVAVSSWMRRRFGAHDAAYQLRGMATAPTVRGTGVGTALLLAGLAECRARGAEVVWARARVTALEFYTSHGFEVVGDEFVDDTTGLPHVVIHRPVIGTPQ